MKRSRKRKCRNCNEKYQPDPRNSSRQKYCTKPECRKASKANSQRCWCSKPENKNYFSGPENVQRVQRWREDNPGYWRRNRPHDENALQDPKNKKPVKKQDDEAHLAYRALQDTLIAQHHVLIGLISNLMGISLQDDIASTVDRLQKWGIDILNGSTLRLGGYPHVIHPPPTIPPKTATSLPHDSIQFGSGACSTRSTPDLQGTL